MLGRLIAAIESLATFPERGSVVPELAELGITRYRQLLHTPMRMIYKVEKSTKRVAVTIVVVADTRRDFRALLERRLLA